MAWTAEQKRDVHAQRKRDRAAEDERRGVKRQPRGGVPLYHRWDESAGAWVLDEAGEALARRQLELPPLPSRPDDLNAWAAANPPPRRDDFATQELFDEAGAVVRDADGHAAPAPSVRRRGALRADGRLSAAYHTLWPRSAPKKGQKTRRRRQRRPRLSGNGS